MIDLQRLELFILKCAVIQADVEKFGRIDNPILGWDSSVSDGGYNEYVSQFSEDSRSGARKMASYYELFYLIENDIRRIIHETLEESHGRSWWDVCVDQAVKDEVEKNRKRELELALSIRSEREIDYQAVEKGARHWAAAVIHWFRRDSEVTSARRRRSNWRTVQLR